MENVIFDPDKFDCFCVERSNGKFIVYYYSNEKTRLSNIWAKFQGLYYRSTYTSILSCFLCNIKVNKIEFDNYNDYVNWICELE